MKALVDIVTVLGAVAMGAEARAAVGTSWWRSIGLLQPVLFVLDVHVVSSNIKFTLSTVLSVS